METSESSKPDCLWSQGTRRNTRSSSNQEKEVKEKNPQSDAKSQDKENATETNESKKKDHSGPGHFVRGQNNEVSEYVTDDGLSYKLFDSAYIASKRSDHPYSIGTIHEIKVSKKDNAVVVVKWYYRPSEVPDSVYRMLVKDRLDGIDDQEEKDLILKMETRNRELFISDEDAMDIFPVSRLRGKCSVKHFSSFQEVKGYDLTSDSFFYILGYNPETRRLTSTQGEVRVGPSHQWTATTRGNVFKATIPDLLPQPPPSSERVNSQYEELVWEPGVNDCDLIMYLRSARSMAAFAGMCDGGSPEEGCVIASRDETTINALNVLFQCKGDTRAAIQVLVKKPLPVTVDRKWTEDEVKRFAKAHRLIGKNFKKIKKDYLPNKEISELVEFYYLWKRVPENLMVQPQSKQRRQATLKRNSKPTIQPAETGEGTSSDIESETDESDKETLEFTCKHCHTTTSEDWNVGGKESVMLCTKCRIFFKKYGDDSQLEMDFNSHSPSDLGDNNRSPMSDVSSEVQPPPFMFKPIKEKMNGPTQEPMSGVDDASDSGDAKKQNKRQWKGDDDQADDKNVVKEKRMKSDDMNEVLDCPPLDVKPIGPHEPNFDSRSRDARIDDKSKVKQEPVSEENSLVRQPMHINHAFSAGMPHFGPYPIAYPSHLAIPVTSTPHAAVNDKDKVTVKEERTNNSDSTERSIKTEIPTDHPPLYPLLPRASFYPPPLHPGVIPGHPPKLHPTDSTYPPPSHLYAWPAEKTNPETSTASQPGCDDVASERKALFSKAMESEASSQEQSKGSSSEKYNEESRSSSRSTPISTSSRIPSSHQTEAKLSQSRPEEFHSNHKQSNIQAQSKMPNVSEPSSNKLPQLQQPLPQPQDPNRSHPSVVEDDSRVSPVDVICTSDEPSLPIYPEHHITVSGSRDIPHTFKRYSDDLPFMDRSRPPIIVYESQKVKLSSFPDFLCSRTDFTWISTKVPVKQEAKVQPQRLPAQVKPQSSQQSSTAKGAGEKESDTPKPKSRDGQAHYPHEMIQIKREPSRPHTSHFRPPTAQHHPSIPMHNGRRSTSVHTPTSSSVADAHKLLPVHSSSPYGTFGQNTPALETLRQIASIDPQREAISGMIAQSPAHYPYHAAQSERDLRERELRERELRERMPKQGLGKLIDTLDPHIAAAQAAALRGIPPTMVHNLVNQQATIDQIRQSCPGAFVDVPGAIPGFPQMLNPNPELPFHPGAAELERIAAEQRMQAERAALEHHYRMELLQSHQHSHVHSHVHLHPQNPPPGLPPAVPPVNDPVINPYTAMAALQAQSHAIAAGFDPAVQAASVNQMLGIRGHPIMPHSGMPIHQAVLPGRPADPSLLLSASQHLQAVAHENLLEQHQRAMQEDYMMRLNFGHKP